MGRIVWPTVQTMASCSGAYTTIDAPARPLTVGGSSGSTTLARFWGLRHGRRYRSRLQLTAGVYSYIDVPGSTYTYAWRINDLGQIMGSRTATQVA